MDATRHRVGARVAVALAAAGGVLLAVGATEASHATAAIRGTTRS